MTNDIRLSNYPHRGVKVEINGTEMQEVCGIELDCPVDGYPILRLKQFATSELDVKLNGMVDPTIYIANPEMELFVEHLSPRLTRYWIARRPGNKPVIK